MHPVNRIMNSLRGIQGPMVRTPRRGSHMRVPALPEEPGPDEYSPIKPPEWWKREQRVAELNKDYPQPSKLKQWWLRNDDRLVVVLICLAVFGILGVIYAVLKRLGVE